MRCAVNSELRSADKLLKLKVDFTKIEFERRRAELEYNREVMKINIERRKAECEAIKNDVERRRAECEVKGVDVERRRAVLVDK